MVRLLLSWMCFFCLLLLCWLPGHSEGSRGSAKGCIRAFLLEKGLPSLLLGFSSTCSHNLAPARRGKSVNSCTRVERAESGNWLQASPPRGGHALPTNVVSWSWPSTVPPAPEAPTHNEVQKVCSSRKRARLHSSNCANLFGLVAWAVRGIYCGLLGPSSDRQSSFGRFVLPVNPALSGLACLKTLELEAERVSLRRRSCVATCTCRQPHGAALHTHRPRKCISREGLLPNLWVPRDDCCVQVEVGVGDGGRDTDDGV